MVQLGQHFKDHRSQYGIDTVKVFLQSLQVTIAGCIGCRNAQIQIDIRVHAQQEVLQQQHQRLPGSGKSDLPWTGWLFIVFPGSYGAKIAIGEDYIERFHAGAVFKFVIANAVPYAHSYLW